MDGRVACHAEGEGEKRGEGDEEGEGERGGERRGSQRLRMWTTEGRDGERSTLLERSAEEEERHAVAWLSSMQCYSVDHRAAAVTSRQFFCKKGK